MSRGFRFLSLGVLGLVILSATASSSQQSPNAKIAVVRADLMTLRSSLRQFLLDCDRYPTDKEGWAVLMKAPASLKSKWHGPYLQWMPKDPWGHIYHYARGKKAPAVWTFGADGKKGGKGLAADIVLDGDTFKSSL
jgi:general secretion pathway protein G